MKRNFTNENFEDFLRESAEELRMRPSDKVWKSISSHLNKRRRRVGFAIGTFLLALSTFAYFTNEGSSHKSNSLVKPTPANNSRESDVFVSAQQRKVQFPNATTPQRFLQLNPGSNKTVSTPLIAVTGQQTLNTNNLVSSNEFISTIVDSYIDNSTVSEKEMLHKPSNVNDKDILFPLTIESVVNSYKLKTQKKKLRLQFYFTPTISYRKLGENKSFLRTQPTSNPNYAPALIYDVNNVVTHKPNLGFEIGMAAKYPVTKNMKLTGGLQFNVNRYDIKAYNAVPSNAVIMFNGRRNSVPDSMKALTSYSNTSSGGYRADWLENYYIQISAPVGVEFKVFGNDKVQFGVATTIQPTYVLGDRAYLISTDYKKYAEVPQLVRRWNVNTAVETFVGYSTGHLNWQVGPQVRYQLLSSFINKYPVKENLFDFGLRVGISVNK